MTSLEQELTEKANGLEAALYIAREGERIAKERLSAVSEELVAAHQENDSLRQQIAHLQNENDDVRNQIEEIISGESI